jgi:hypothetical protein
MAKNDTKQDQNQTSTEQASTEQASTGQGQTSTELRAPGGDPENQATIQTMEAPELRNAVVELLTIIDDSDELDVVVTVADDGTVTVVAA